MTAVEIDSTEGLRDRVLDAAARRAPLRIVGRGTWLDAGRPVRAVETLSTRELTGISEYVPGDLTLTAGAGTTLAEIREATAVHNQWLALEPHGSDEGSIGATLVTASAGPLSTFFGTPRDLALGVEFVTGLGVVARGGGRVVKNVAGFDLTRLLTGSWGTVGIVTEVTVRLHARPEADESFAIPFAGGGSPGDLARLRAMLRRLPFRPYACEAVSASLAREVGAGSDAAALIRVAGNAEAVKAQRAAMAELADEQPTEIDPHVWTRLRTIEPPGAIVFRLSRLPSEIDRAWAEATAIASSCAGTLVHGTPARGIVRCIVPRDDGVIACLQRVFTAPPTSVRIGERLPADLWLAITTSAPTGDPISSRIKATFDPHHVLNPGVFGEQS
jgi:glycolate oxidase FAD binding subunit